MKLVAILPLISLLAACDGDTPIPEIPTNMNDFTFRFNRALVEENSSQNQLISGLSAQMALSMLATGAEGTSYETLAKLLGTKSREDLNSANKAIADRLTASKGAEFSIANSIWSLAGIQPSATYQDTLQANYAAQFEALSGTGSSEVDKVNNWVNRKTKGRIPRILDQIDPANRLFLINALTFDGKWKVPFDPQNTEARDFTLASKTTVEVPSMMMLDAKFPYAKLANGSRALKLGYEGDEFSTLLILPAEGTSAVKAFREMTETAFDATRKALHEVKLRVQLPRLKMKAKYNLTPASASTEALGLAPLFKDIDLGRISPELAHETKISDITQLTMLEWDESGTKAAAATSIGISTLSIPVDPPEFIANRPFMFFLFHERSGAIVFSGLVNDPR